MDCFFRALDPDVNRGTPLLVPRYASGCVYHPDNNRDRHR